MEGTLAPSAKDSTYIGTYIARYLVTLLEIVLAQRRTLDPTFQDSL